MALASGQVVHNGDAHDADGRLIVALTGGDESPTTATEPITASVDDAATSQTIFASNSNAIGRTVFNDSTSTLYLKLSATAATTTNYNVKLVAGAYYEFPRPVYTGAVNGIWSSDSTGAAKTTEYTN